MKPTIVQGALVLAVVGALVAAAVPGADRACRGVKPLHLRGPGGRASVTRYEKGCPGKVPHVLLEFGRGGPGQEFVLAERVRVLHVRWLSADSLVIDYRSRTRGAIRERLVRAGDDSVRVILRGLIGRTQ